MINSDTLNRYKPTSINLHWLTLFLMAAIYASIELHEIIPRGNPLRQATEDWHIYLGFSLIPIVLYRLFYILISPIPPITPPPPQWQATVTKLMKIYLYVLMLGMPLLGWIYLSADGDAINVWSLPLPAITPQSEGLAEFAEEAHEILGLSGYLFIPVHAFAAIYHHFLIKDNTLSRMLPKFLVKD
ncbi:MAG: cytochrome b [Proteobacteria bacterium]|jgi:superoxide oxidase|nr:cytochrome b [Pseudomonadota bacterium]